MSTYSNETDDRMGRIVGVEDDEENAWCFDCADREIRNAGETAFAMDVYAGWGGARRKCCVCGRRLGEASNQDQTRDESDPASSQGAS